MKYLVSSIILTFFSISSFSQAPQNFSYQTVIRNSSNQLLANQQVGIKISILQASETGIVVYSERHTPSTNANGLATLSIGTGAVLSGNFQNINWASGSYYIQTDTDPNGGSNYTITSTQQLLSVPYALYAETSGSSTPGPQGEQGPIGQTGAQGPIGETGPQGNPASDDQGLSVSETGDTLFLQNGGFVIIPGISSSNYGGSHNCGATDIHNTSKVYGALIDQQGNSYKTIVLGAQIWMAENLKTSVYRNGEAITTNQSDNVWNNANSTQIGAWAYYENNSQNECPYGKLYNWYAVVDSRNLCPVGWKIPTDADWTLLSNYLGGEAISGGKMKSSNSNYWTAPNNSATNESGFSGLPGGFRDDFGPFGLLGSNGYWWSSTPSVSNNAWSRYLDTDNGQLQRYSINKIDGFSVRCLKE